MNPVRKAKSLIRKIEYYYHLNKRVKKLKLSILRAEPLKIIIGASNKKQSNWITTEYDELNLLRTNDWNELFKNKKIDALLSEHVWEHLSLQDGETAARNCYEHLKSGAYIRVAVPDGYFPDAKYIENVRPGGSGPGCDDHKVLYTYQTLEDVFKKAGFKTKLLEYFDDSGSFHATDWDSNLGYVSRSARFDERNLAGKLNYTSIILDAYKE